MHEWLTIQSSHRWLLVPRTRALTPFLQSWNLLLSHFTLFHCDYFLNSAVSVISFKSTLQAKKGCDCVPQPVSAETQHSSERTLIWEPDFVKGFVCLELLKSWVQEYQITSCNSNIFTGLVFLISFEIYCNKKQSARNSPWLTLLCLWLEWVISLLLISDSLGYLHPTGNC